MTPRRSGVLQPPSMSCSRGSNKPSPRGTRPKPTCVPQERLRRFVADASHELRTPLAAVSAYAELFERGASSRPEDLGRVLQGIRTETSRMGRLVEDLLLLTRLDEGIPLSLGPVELVSLAADNGADCRRCRSAMAGHPCG